MPPITRLLLTFSLLLQASASMSAETLKLECFAVQRSSPYFVLTSLFEKLYNPLGYQLDWQNEAKQPGVSQRLIEGQMDGSCGRLKVEGYQEVWPHMEFLDTPVAAVHMAIWVRKETEALNPRTDKIGYLDSIELNKRLVEGMQFTNAVAFNRPGELLQALRSQRVDGIIADEGMLAFGPFAKDIQREGIYVFERLSKSHAYPMIHKRHATLKGDLDKHLSVLTRRFDDVTTVSESQAPERQKASRDSNRPVIVLGCPRHPGSLISQAFEALHSQALANIGFDLKMEPLPFLRVEQGLADGYLAGTCGRPKQFNRALGVPLVPVDYVLTRISVQLWGNRLQPWRESIFDLPKGSRVAVVRGIPLGKPELQAYFQKRGVTLIERGNLRQVVKMLSSGEVDYALGYQTPVIDAMNALRSDRDLYLVASGPKQKIIPFLSGEYAHIRDDFAESLRQLETNFEQTLLELSSRNLVYYHP
jgi:ABC-type amino acid transport substrate-binding protein